MQLGSVCTLSALDLHEELFKQATHLNHMIIIDTEEERDTISFGSSPVDDPMNCAFVHVVRPPHHKICHVNDEAIVDCWCWNPYVLG